MQSAIVIGRCNGHIRNNMDIRNRAVTRFRVGGKVCEDSLDFSLTRFSRHPAEGMGMPEEGMRCL